MRRKWNERYKNLTKRPPVNGYLQRLAAKLPKGRALDIGCGVGQNSEFLAKMGWEVDAVDISQVGLAKLTEHASIHPHCMDIRNFDIKKERYDLILSINFLDTTLFSRIEEGLRSGGVFLIQTFTPHSDMNPKFTIEPQELLRAFEGLHVLYYDCFDEERQVVLIAQKD